MIEEESIQFEYCNKVDLHVTDISTKLDNVVSVAAEHGFRGIVVTLGQITALVKEINKPLFGDKQILPIAVIDYPFGNSSIDVRAYSLASAKEKGAKEVEIVAPYPMIANHDFRGIYEDAQSLVAAAKKYDISIKYVLDQNSEFIEDSIRTKLCRIMSSTRVPFISTSLGYFDEEIDHSDNIVKMRALKNKIGCPIKAYVPTSDPNEFALYPKAGADILGLEWNVAPFLVHAYEDMVIKKQ